MMSAIPLNSQGKGVVIVDVPKWKSLDKGTKFEQVTRETSSIESEPTSTLDISSHSPNSPTSTSTLSNSGNGICLEEWESMFPNGDGALLPWLMGETDDIGFRTLLQSGNLVDYEGNAGLGVVEQGSGFENLSHALVAGIDSNSGANLGFGDNGKMGSFLPNCSSGVVGSSSILGSVPLGFGGLGLSNPQLFDVGNDKNNQFLNSQSQLVMNQQQANPSFLMGQLGYGQVEPYMFQPQAKRHNPGVVLDPILAQMVKNPFAEPSHELLLRKQQLNMQQVSMGLANQLVPKPLISSKQNHNQHYPLPLQQEQSYEQALKDQLFKAADMIQTGNFSLAEEILARLNHNHSLPAKPLIRVALYLKEALQMILLMSNPVAAPPPKTLTPYDVVHKMNAYKVFSEVSPITQFVNFTCTQAILESLDDADVIHIIDFDIGCGAQWASLIQELPLRKKGASSLKITALVSLSTSHPFELGLMRENLVQFASDIGVVFELEVVNLDLFDASSSSSSSSSSMLNVTTLEDEALAVSIPIWASSNRPSILPSILRFIKQCSPKIVVSFDRGFDRFDVPFPHHLFHTLESCTNFLESLDGLSVASDIVSKIEKYFVQPRLENSVLGRLHAPDKMPHWKNLFASAGFMPLHFSNFTETQADYVVKRTPARGFHVEKRQASLVLSWQGRELVAASAWRC